MVSVPCKWSVIESDITIWQMGEFRMKGLESRTSHWV